MERVGNLCDHPKKFSAPIEDAVAIEQVGPSAREVNRCRIW